MPVKVSWDNRQKTIIRYDFTGHWEWLEYKAAIDQANAMLGSVNHTVDAIVDLQRSAPLAPSVANQTDAPVMVPKNLGRVIVTPTCPLVRAMANAFHRIFDHEPRDVMLAESVREARRILTNNGWR